MNNCIFSEKFTLSFNIVMMLIVIPLLNHVLYPFFREYVPNMLKRIGVGFFLAGFAALTSLILSAVGANRHTIDVDQCMFTANFSASTKHYVHNSAPDYLIIIPLFLNMLAEIFINVTCKFSTVSCSKTIIIGCMVHVATYGLVNSLIYIYIYIFSFYVGLEFFYAQSPHKMRGMMIGLFFFVWGVASALAETLILMFSKIPHIGPPLTCDFWYYFMYVVYAVLAFVVYVVLACWYKNRQRGETDSDIFYRKS